MTVSPSAVFIRAGRIHSSRARQAIHANSKAFPNAIPLFYGAYVMVNLAIFSYAMPYLRNLPPYNQVLNMWSFWILTSSVAFMTFTLTFAGVVQTHLQRVLGGTYMEVQDQLALFYWMRFGAGLFTLL